MSAMLIFDAHLDLAMNAMEWNRDLSRPIEEIRASEEGLNDKPDRGQSTVCFEEMRRGGLGLCVGTQIARYVKPGNPLPGWRSPEQAWAQTQGQLAWYRAMEEAGYLVQISNRSQLEQHLRRWEEWLAGRNGNGTAADAASSSSDETEPRIGYISSLEGADSLVTLKHLERAYANGLRAVGPAHYGPGIYAQGTDATGGLGARGRELVQAMDRLGMILDISHLCDDSFWEAIDLFRGPLWASHSNCRALVPHNRQLSDEQIKQLVQRGAVIGVVMDGWMLRPNWVRGQTTPKSAGLTLAQVVDHLDHICQIAGNTSHCGIGSDLDGAYGREQCPSDVETIADLARLAGLLRDRGYREDDVVKIMHGNFLRVLREAWK